MDPVTVRYVGGPTAVLEAGGVRMVIDPTFDPPGRYPLGSRALQKTSGPGLSPEAVGRVDVVLLSHDQHPDNLDRAGREFLATAGRVLSTPQAHERLGDLVEPMEPWDSVALDGPDGRSLLITAAPARHGPPGSEPVVGQVTGFVVSWAEAPTIYVSGDNASLDHVRAVAERFGPVDVALIFAGAARTALLDGAYLTLTSAEAAQAAMILGATHVVPLHYEQWAHFSQGPDTVVAAFAAAGLGDRLHLLAPGAAVELAG
jgi:L-ascorbate metabolism protein UlaG (beta-lactamase superfamily)